MGFRSGCRRVARCRMVEGLAVALKKLSTYRKKRDFGKTAEPSGDVKVAPAKQRRFVIQKHDATRLHYDLRLEFDGVFKSWAVTRGTVARSARQAAGGRGRGSPARLRRFRRHHSGRPVWRRHRACCGIAATWESDDPERGFKKGDLKFTLHGDKLHGSWVLVRMKGDRYGGKRTNWLLIKHRDEFAKEGEANDILEEDRSVASGRTMDADRRKARARRQSRSCWPRARHKADAVWHSNRGDAADARAGRKTAALRATPETRTRAPAQSAKPKQVSAMPDFVAPQLCASVERPPNSDGWCHEVKFDGYRVQLRIEDGDAALLTRKGLDWTDKFGAIARAARALPDALIDGEIVALDHNGVPSFSALQAAIADGKTGDLIFFAFDLLFADGEDLRRAAAARAQGAPEAPAGGGGTERKS